MSATLVAGIVALLVTLIGSATGIVGSVQYGKAKAELKAVKRRADDAEAVLKKRSEPLPTDRVYGDRLRRTKDRLARLRDRAAK